MSRTATSGRRKTRRSEECQLSRERIRGDGEWRLVRHQEAGGGLRWHPKSAVSLFCSFAVFAAESVGEDEGGTTVLYDNELMMMQMMIMTRDILVSRP